MEVDGGTLHWVGDKCQSDVNALDLDDVPEHDALRCCPETLLADAGEFKFAPLTEQADLDEAMEFFPRLEETGPRDLPLELLKSGRWAPRQLDRRYEDQLRAYMLLGKADLNGDGVPSGCTST
jgi:hypothetical protein